MTYITKKSEKKIRSLTERLLILKGIAEGVNWIHSNNPPIIHHDLSPQNILLDENKVPKICDFGLSAIKKKNKTTDKAGSKLYCAPEILRKDDHDEKIDVYSYGIIFWQLMTLEKTPFSQEISTSIGIGKLLNRICYHSKRPTLMDIRIPRPTKKLISHMWDDNPKIRPNFNSIKEELNDIIIECAIPTKDFSARDFWRNNILSREGIVVDYEAFLDRFTNHCKINYNDLYDIQDHQGVKDCIKHFFCGEKGDNVTLENFGTIISWFGPIYDMHNVFLTNRILVICRHGWFKGNISRNDANEILQNQNMAFLVRLTIPDEEKTNIVIEEHPLTISYKISKSRGEALHSKIVYDSGLYKTEILMKDKYNFEQNNLIDLIEEVVEQTGLREAETGGKSPNKYFEKYFQDMDLEHKYS